MELKQDDKKYIESLENKLQKKASLFFIYINSFYKIFIKYINNIENFLEFYKKIYIKVEKPIKLYLKLNYFIWQKLNLIIRALSFPFNFFWLVFYHKIQLHKKNYTLLDEPGVHMITGCMGSGKSSSIYYQITQDLKANGKAAYINTALEKPEIDLDGEEYVYNRQFNLNEFFKNGKQIKKFNTLKFDKIVIDEMNYYLNHRLNKSKDYNNILIPFLKQVTNMRHDGIKQIIILTQQPIMDNQLMNVVTYYHQVQIKKGLLYKFWLKTGIELKKTFGIKGWNFKTQIIQGGRVEEDKKSSKWFLKYDNKSYILDTFDTLNMKDRKEKETMGIDKLDFK